MSESGRSVAGRGRRRRWVLLVLAAVVAIPLGRFAFDWITYPSDRTPEGAYLRIVTAVNSGRPADFFAYLETAAQHACYTIRDYRRASRERILAAYPEPEQEALLAAHADEALAADGADVFALYARRRGWTEQLRRDLSRPKQIVIKGDRATIETERGTRYSFRRRENGIWGLAQFTAELTADAEKAARDAAMVERAAADYERVRAQGGLPSPAAGLP